MSATPIPLPEVLKLVQNLPGLARHLGMRHHIDTVDGQPKLVVRMTVDERHAGAPGRIHGGAVMAMLDTALGAEAMQHALPRGLGTSTVEMKVNFMAPIPLGTSLLGRTVLEMAGKRLLVIRGALHNERTDECLALALGTFNLFPLSRFVSTASAQT